jgi:hypothetical protein
MMKESHHVVMGKDMLHRKADITAGWKSDSNTFKRIKILRGGGGVRMGAKGYMQEEIGINQIVILDTPQ